VPTMCRPRSLGSIQVTDYAALLDAIEARLREMQDEHAPLCACIRCEHLPALVGWALEMVEELRLDLEEPDKWRRHRAEAHVAMMARGLGLQAERG
jgi:hypothetical protein